MTSSEFRQYLKKEHEFDNRWNYLVGIFFVALSPAINFYDPLTIPIETNSNRVELLTLLIMDLLPTGIGIYIIWLTYSQYRVHEYHSTKPKEEKLRILKIYLDKMWGHCGVKIIIIYSATLTPKSLYIKKLI